MHYARHVYFTSSSSPKCGKKKMRKGEMCNTKLPALNYRTQLKR